MDTASTVDAFTHSQAGHVDSATVPGMGDRAYYAPSLCTLTLMRGNTLVMFQASLMGVPGAAPPKPDVLKSDLIALGHLVDSQL